MPRVNWQAVKGDGILGFVGYKVGMVTCFVKDNTADSRSKGQRIMMPATVIETPTIKILSVRFYKQGKVMNEVLNDNLEKELKKKLKLPKEIKKPNIDEIKDYDDVRIIVYSQPKKTNIKKTPDIIELAIGGSLDKKIELIKSHLGKEISISEVLKASQLVDVRGLTKGKGLQGPVKRFGITFKSHKSEKGVRRPGSLGPWHPHHVNFRAPMAGQLGMFTRTLFNNKIIDVAKIHEKNINPKCGFDKYGVIKGDYVIIRGSVQGPEKRQLLLTLSLRPSKKQIKKNFEFIRIA